MAAKSSKKTKKEDTTNSGKNVQEIAPSDLSAEELEQAITKQAEEADSKKPENNDASEEKSDQQVIAETDTEGVPIIVRRRNSYINQQKQGLVKNDSDDEEQAPDKAAKLHEETVIKPPSETSKVVEVPKSEEAPKSLEEPVKTERENSQDTAVSAPAASSEMHQTEIEAPSSKPPEEMDPQPAVSNQDETKTQESEPIGMPALNKAQSGQSPAKKSAQKPTVFDTTEYHLPIKVRNSNYVNGAVAWVVLLIALVGAGGYVMYRLGVFDLSQISF